MNEQPNNETITQSSSRDLQIIEDDAFSYEGYQVVRGEFFAHTYEPSSTLPLLKYMSVQKKRMERQKYPAPQHILRNGRTSSVSLLKNTRAIYRSTCLTAMQSLEFPRIRSRQKKMKTQQNRQRRKHIMSNQPSSQPILCIDLKKNRIRIHKLTLHMLGDPEYIQLLVNPCTHMIAVRKSVRQDYLAHHVRACYSDIRNSYELYSRELLQTLRQTNSELSNNRSYRIYGAINQKEGLASFSMQECVLVDDSARTEETV